MVMVVLEMSSLQGAGEMLLKACGFAVTTVSTSCE